MRIQTYQHTTPPPYNFQYTDLETTSRDVRSLAVDNIYHGIIGGSNLIWPIWLDNIYHGLLLLILFLKNGNVPTSLKNTFFLQSRSCAAHYKWGEKCTRESWNKQSKVYYCFLIHSWWIYPKQHTISISISYLIPCSSNGQSPTPTVIDHLCMLVANNLLYYYLQSFSFVL
jgi:hypothetical protein